MEGEGESGGEVSDEEAVVEGEARMFWLCLETKKDRGDIILSRSI